jgi:hypothetical protein
MVAGERGRVDSLYAATTSNYIAIFMSMSPAVVEYRISWAFSMWLHLLISEVHVYSGFPYHFSVKLCVR